MVMHLFAGPRREGDVQQRIEDLARLHDLDVLVLSIDLLVCARWGLADPFTFDTLMSLIAEGLIDGIIGGPPCSTWSRARQRAGCLQVASTVQVALRTVQVASATM